MGRDDLRDLKTTAEIVATYRAARDRLMNPPNAIPATAVARPAPPPAKRRRLLTSEMIAAVLHVVAESYDLDPRELIKPDRRPRLMRSRRIAIWLAHDMIGASLSLLGHSFRRDHGTIRYTLRAIDRALDRDPDLAREVAMMRRKVLKFFEQQNQQRESQP